MLLCLISLSPFGQDKNTPLHLAARHGNKEVVKLLVSETTVDGVDKVWLETWQETVSSISIPE